MKISQTNFLTAPRQSYQITPYNKQENKQDVFVKNTNTVSFTGNDDYQNPYQQVLQRPELVQKVMELVTTAATILVGKAAGIGFKKDECDIDIDSICKTAASEENQNDEYKQELDKLKKENNSLRTLLAQKEAVEIDTETSTNPFTPDSGDVTDAETIENIFDESEEQNYGFVFPKKKVGVLSKAQKDLKSLTTGLNLNQEQGEKLTQICKELLQNGSHQIGDEIVDNKQITSDLVNRLIVSTKNDLSQIIDEFYEKCEIEPKNNSQNAQLYKTETPKIAGVTVVGKIDLDSIKDGRKIKNQATESTEGTKSDYVYTRTEKRPRIKKPANAQDTDIDTSQLEVKSSQVSIFRIPGTVDDDVNKNLKQLLLKFEKQVEKDIEKPYYQNNQRVSVKLLPNDTLTELSKSPYKNINKKNIAEITDSINADSRFHQMFTLHAAMRLIDRFVDFNSDVTIEDQCHNILDNMVHVLQKSFKSGLEVRKYVDENGFIGLRLLISEDSYDNEARKVFGSYPFKLGICEYQPDSNFFDKRIKQPLICTIFANGI